MSAPVVMALRARANALKGQASSERASYVDPEYTEKHNDKIELLLWLSREFDTLADSIELLLP